MKPTIRFLALASALGFSACHNDTTAPATGGSIQLTAAQASAIQSRVGLLAPVHPELAWLADTIKLVATAGIELTPVSLTTDLTDGPFYAVALQRKITTSFSGSSAFDVILFNDPSNPTDFIIVSGWTNPASATHQPPDSFTGQFGSPTATSVASAHLFHVSGSTVTAWRANAGTATFTSGSAGAACSSVTSTTTVTCQVSDLQAAFNITSAMSDVLTVSATRSASVSSSDVNGIVIKMLIQ